MSLGLNRFAICATAHKAEGLAAITGWLFLTRTPTCKAGVNTVSQCFAWYVC
jgi:hypothetical protein